MDLSKPLALPAGSVRAILALMAMATACHSFVVTGTITVELVSFTAPIITYYFATRGQEERLATPAEEPLAQPYAFDEEVTEPVAFGDERKRG